MTQSTNKPTHRLVRYYGDGRNAPSATVGAVWANDNGRLTIVLNTPFEQVRLTAFPADDASASS